MFYYLALYNRNSPQAPFSTIQSTTPFHSICVGQKVQLPNNPALEVNDVTHGLSRDAQGNDHSIMMVLLSPPSVGVVFGGGNPVPWPW